MSDDHYRRNKEFYRDQDRRRDHFLEDQRYEQKRQRERSEEAFREIRRGNTMRALGAIDPELAIRYYELSQSAPRRVSEGDRHPTEPHVVAAANGQWIPEGGYAWSDESSQSNLGVRWRPGQNNAKHPHVVASDTEGKWTPAPGYQWVDKDAAGDLRVQWSPGKSHREHEHVVASDTEGEWTPAPGYRWVDRGSFGDLRVQWSPGNPHPQREHMVEADAEGQWVFSVLHRFPSDRYRFLTPARWLPGDPPFSGFSWDPIDPKRKPRG